MGFIGDIAGKIGNQFGFGGGANQFQAKAPVNTFQASGVPIQDPGYIQAIQQSMAGQQGLVGQLQGQAAGTGPSVAQPLLQQATDQNNSLSAGAIGSIRGINPGLGARMILQQRAQNQQGAAQQAAILRNQEQLNAQGLLGHVLQGQLGTAAAGNQGLQGLGVQQNLGVQGINANVAAGNQQADLSSQGINAGVAAQNADISSRAIGGLLGGLGSLAGMGGGGGGGGLSVDSAWQGINAAGGLPTAGLGIAGGGLIPGQAPVAGDSPKNDKVPGMLSPGEIVIPRSIAQGPDAPEKAAEFVKAIRRKHYAKGGEVPHYGHVLKYMRESNERLERIEKQLGHFADGGEVKSARTAPQTAPYEPFRADRVYNKAMPGAAEAEAVARGEKANAFFNQLEQAKARGARYADGGEVKESHPADAFVEMLRRALTRSGPSSSSPSVFDAKSATDLHKKRLGEALEGAK